jgi:pimeloyl-ACP methyl ester carboxylesterase
MSRLGRILLGVLIVLVLLVVVGPLVIPVRPLEGLVPPRQLADPDSKFMEVDGLQFHYKQAGEGRPAMLLLHGFSSSTFTWRNVSGRLTALGTVVSYDRPSSGLTERPLPGHPRMQGGAAWSGINPYSPQAQADQAVEIMDKLGIEKAVLIGNSAGGTVAMLTALEHPERVAALVLVDPAIYAGGGAPAWIRPLLGTPQFQRIGPLSGRFLAGSGDRLLTLAWHDPSRVTPDVLEGYRKATQAENWDQGLWELTKASQDLNLETRLAEVTQPTLVITGDDDRIVPTEQSVRLAAELPNAELVVIPQCGHVPQEECPGPWLDAVTEFVERFK